MLSSQFEAAGDMDGDGEDEEAVLLYENSGGSGTFAYLAVVKEQEGICRSVATLSLGDRVKVMKGEIENNILEVELLEHAQGDPMCCPTRKVVKRFRLSDGRLAECKN